MRALEVEDESGMTISFLTYFFRVVKDRVREVITPSSPRAQRASCEERGDERRGLR